MVYLTADNAELYVTCSGTVLDVRSAMLRIERFLRVSGIDEDVTQDLNLALTEAMTNIARHGYPGGSGPISIRLFLSDHGVQCRLTDRGISFDPRDLGHALPDLEMCPEGGYGWFLIRSLSQNLCYSRENDLNILSFTVPACLKG